VARSSSKQLEYIRNFDINNKCRQWTSAQQPTTVYHMLYVEADSIGVKEYRWK